MNPESWVVCTALALTLVACGEAGDVDDWDYESMSEQADDVEAALTSPLVSMGSSGRLVYSKYANRGSTLKSNRLPDFSFAGFRGGGVRIPDVPTVMTLSPQAGDNRSRIQAALDELAKRAPDANGFRGALLLEKGRYDVSDTLKIPKDGIVLRGAGQDASGTVLVATAKKAYTLLDTKGGVGAPEVAGTRTRITTAFVPVGAQTFEVKSSTSFKPGDSVVVLRTPNKKWISDLKMEPYGWTPEYFEVPHERTVVAISGNQITVDIPLVDALEDQYGGGYLYRSNLQRTRHIGVEDLRLESIYASETDENHGWDAVKLDGVTDSWARRITVQYFGYAAVKVRGSTFVTVQDAACLDPKSLIEGGRRYPFVVADSTGVLFQRLFVRGGRHSFVSHSRVPGPNVWLDALALQSHTDDGPHHRWATGLLFDNTRSSALHVQNRKKSGTGHGWSGAQVLFYNAMATSSSAGTPWSWSAAPAPGSLICDAPMGAMNYAIGCVGSKNEGTWAPEEPFGIWQSHGKPVAPRSLYLAQLKDRLGKHAVDSTTVPLQRSDRIWKSLESWAGEGRLSDVLRSQSDPSCAKGILSDGICCAASCGKCGGNDCGSRPGGPDACCRSTIAQAAVSCSGSKAPCVITGDPTCSTGVMSADGKTCCKESCGTCGGIDCSSRPGGASGCCVGKIAASGILCSGNVAPCVLTP